MIDAVQKTIFGGSRSRYRKNCNALITECPTSYQKCPCRSQRPQRISMVCFGSPPNYKRDEVAPSHGARPTARRLITPPSAGSYVLLAISGAKLSALGQKRRFEPQLVTPGLATTLDMSLANCREGPVSDSRSGAKANLTRSLCQLVRPNLQGLRGPAPSPP